MNHRLKTALAAMGIVSKKAKDASMIFEIDGANGEKLTFPEANDITEIEEGSAVTAEDGEHVFVADGKTYTIKVEAGKVTSLEVTEEEPLVDSEMSAETIEMLQAIANQFEENATALASLRTELETARTESESFKTAFAEMKALMSHGGDDTDDDKDKNLVIGGKKIDLKKINIK
jgi:hypothetical protein